MAADEPNWDQARYSARVAAAEEQLRRGQHKYPRTLPEQATASFAVLLLLHGAGWPTHLLWERWQASHPPGSVAMLVHMKAGVTVGPGMPGLELITSRRLRTSVSSQWGDISLVQAQLDSLAEVLRRCPKASHIALASGHDIPLQLIQPGLLLPGVSMFGSYQFGDKEARTLKVAAVDELVSEASMTEDEAQGWGRALIFHHQWMVLSREHAAALVSLSREIMVVGRVIHRACESVKAGMAPDEFALVTALRANGFVRSIQRVELKAGMRYPPGCLLNSYPTLVLFPAESSPHPILWTDMEEKINCQVEKQHTGQQYFKQLSLKECLDISQDRCALFFRKVEIRQTRGEELAKLLSSLEAMWRGRKASSSAASSGGTSGGGSRKGKRGRQHQQGAKSASGRRCSGDSNLALSSGLDSEAEGTADEAEQPKKVKH